MAIEALSRQQAADSKDLISRSSLLAKYDEQHEGPPGRARKLIEDEPPVLGTNLAEVGTDLISRAQAIDAVNRLSLGETDATRLAMRIWDYLERLPSAQPTFDARDTQYNLPIGTDLISRRAAINMCRKPRMRNADCSDFEMEIMMLPSAGPKRGKWINDRCSVCGYGVMPWNNTPYCHRCGADMRGEQDG